MTTKTEQELRPLNHTANGLPLEARSLLALPAAMRKRAEESRRRNEADERRCSVPPQIATETDA